jgi:PAS domain S-box-containing protein
MDKKSQSSELNNIAHSLLDKYRNIIGAQNKEGLRIEKIVELIITYYENIIVSMPGNVYWLDKDCIGMGCNKNVLEMLGLKSLTEFKGLTFEEMGKIGHWTDEATQSFKKDTLEVLRTGNAKMNVEELPIPHSDGRLLYFLTSRVPLFDNQGKVVGVVGNSTDITDRKRAEALQKEKEIMEEKIAFMATLAGYVAHEMRTPLSTLLLYLDLLKGNETEKNQKVKEKTFDKLIDDGKHTVKLANSFIDMLLVKLRKMSTEQIDKENFQHSLIVEDVQDALTQYPFSDEQRKIVHWDKKDAFVYLGDAALTNHIIFNLLKNALNVIGEENKGEINISFKQAADCNQLIFMDTAKGIPQKLLPHIFDAFVTKSKAGKGTGLGLAFCKMVMQSYGGDIICESKEGKYTKFVLSFPKIPGVG